MKRSLSAWVVLIASTVVFLLPGIGWACSCTETSPRATHRTADATFVGIAIATSTERPGKVARTTFAVSHVWKGDVPATVIVETGLASEDCPFDFVPSTRYAIFAEGDAARGFRTDSCSNPSDLTAIGRAGLSTEDCSEQRPDRCVIARYDPTSAVSPEPMAVDGPGVGGPGAPRSGPIAAAGVLLLASAVGTYAAYRARGVQPGGSPPGRR